MPISRSEMSRLISGRGYTIKELLKIKQEHIEKLENFFKNAKVEKMVSAWNLGYGGTNSQAHFIIGENEWNALSDEAKAQYWRISHFDHYVGENGEEKPISPPQLIGLELRLAFGYEEYEEQEEVLKSEHKNINGKIKPSCQEYLKFDKRKY